MNQNTNKTLHIALFSLMTIGGLNWGLVGLFNFNLVELVIGSWSPALERIIYIVIGVASAYIFATHKRDCRICGAAR